MSAADTDDFKFKFNFNSSLSDPNASTVKTVKTSTSLDSLKKELAAHQHKQRLITLEKKLQNIKDKQVLIRQEFQAALRRYDHGVQTRRKYDDLIKQVHKLETFTKPIAVRNGLLSSAAPNLLLDALAEASSTSTSGPASISAYRRTRTKVDHDLADLEHARSKLLEELLIEAQRKESSRQINISINSINGHNRYSVAGASYNVVTPKRKAELREWLLNHPPIPSLMATLNSKIAACRNTIAKEQAQLQGLRSADRRIVQMLIETQHSARKLLEQNHQQWTANNRLFRSLTASHYRVDSRVDSRVSGGINGIEALHPIGLWFMDQMRNRMSELQSTEFLFSEAIRRHA